MMTDDESESPFFWTTPRERAIAIAAATGALIVGVWLGVFIVPSEALIEPVAGDGTGDGMSKNFHPVPTRLPVFSLILLGIGAYSAWYQVRPDFDQDGDSDE